MTIQRQYVLPNCSLVLEGLSTDQPNVLSILANAEFKIVGIEQPLTGGSEFFQALAAAVSDYCQRLLSGLNHPGHMASQSSVVVEPAEGQYHRLIVKPEILGEADQQTPPEALNLSTVQLFDMAEAIDQFYTDTQTLPDFSVRLTPLPRKYVRPAEPLVQRAIPPLLGLGTLAIAAVGLFFIPVPEVEPEAFNQQNNPVEEQTENDPAVGTPDDVPALEPTDGAAEDSGASNTIEPASAILDGAQLAAIQQQVQQQVSGALSADATFEQPLRYRVSVAENGDILGYNHLDEVSLENLDSTPLPELTYIPVESATVEPVAQFDVSFTTDGSVEVVSEQGAITPEAAPAADVESPTPETTEETDPQESSEASDAGSAVAAPAVTSSAATGDASSRTLSATVATPIQDLDQIYELNQELRRTIINNRDRNGSGPILRYRVRLDQGGNITGYEAANPAAAENTTAVDIASLVQAVDTEQPQLDFLVVISDSNVVEVNPWNGWRPRN
ncbi:MAG: DUF4335 domain-containing protein [Cyanobacteria bacterium P01_A01_bin.15]